MVLLVMRAILYIGYGLICDAQVYGNTMSGYRTVIGEIRDLGKVKGTDPWIESRLRL